MDDSERTPVESPFALSQVMSKLVKIEMLTHTAANNSVLMVAQFGALRAEVTGHGRRLTALEVGSRWLPLIFSSLALAVSIWSAMLPHR